VIQCEITLLLTNWMHPVFWILIQQSEWQMERINVCNEGMGGPMDPKIIWLKLLVSTAPSLKSELREVREHDQFVFVLHLSKGSGIRWTSPYIAVVQKTTHGNLQPLSLWGPLCSPWTLVADPTRQASSFQAIPGHFTIVLIPSLSTPSQPLIET
jgi:hypothetical protein